MSARATAVLFLAACSGTPMVAPTPDLALGCAAPTPDGGTACTASLDCGAGAACFAGTCRPTPSCASDCSCTGGRVCTGGLCVAPSGAACGPCDTACTQAGGLCNAGGCAPKCNDTTIFCPLGFQCFFPHAGAMGRCIPTIAKDCTGCAADTDCPAGEVCNFNNRRCVPAPTGPDARLEMSGADFLAPGPGGTMTKAREVTYSLGFYSRRDPSFDTFDLAAGTCGTQRSTSTVNAPYPLGPLRDAGAMLTLALPAKSIPFLGQKDPNPSYGFQYSGSGFMVSDWVPGRASWTGTGGADVGAFTAAGTIPVTFTTTPDVLGMTPVQASAATGLTITFDTAAQAGVGSFVEVSYNDVAGGMVTSLTQIACRAADGATSVSIPGTMLASAPRSVQLGLTVSRATVVDFTTSGVKRGRAVFGNQQLGAVVVGP